MSGFDAFSYYFREKKRQRETERWRDGERERGRERERESWEETVDVVVVGG